MARIGFIGLGNMGLPMARNLIKAGHAVQGFDVSKAQVDALVAAGGSGAKDVKAAIAGVDVVITMLPAGEHVLAAYEPGAGIIGINHLSADP
jgi:3-hydroxyisobutyrate dehydrogenase